MARTLGTSKAGGAQANSPYKSDVILTDHSDTVTGIVFSDVAGTLHIFQSGNGTNWDLDETVAVSASTGTKYNITIIGAYLKLEFAWPSGTQATFRLSSRLQSAGNE